MRAFCQLALLVSSDANQRQKLLDLAHSFDDTGTTVAETSSVRITLAASQANYQVPFGGVTTASLVLIVADDEVEVRLNAADAPLVPVRPVPAQVAGSVLSSLQALDQPGLVLWRGAVESIYLTNPSSSATATVFVALLGDAA